MADYHKACLTIAGSDCSGGAGIQADLKTFAATGVYGMSVITAVTAQNTVAVYDSYDLPEAMVRRQLKAVFEDIIPDAVKVGMVSSPELIHCIADMLEHYKAKVTVIDPVMISKSGYDLMKPEAVATFQRRLLPLAHLLTPNIPEAEVMSGMKIKNLEDMRTAGEAILRMGAEYVLIKGGHMPDTADDLLVGQDGTREILHQERIDSTNTHGTGCTISSAIASYLAQGNDMVSAVHMAKQYITAAIAASFQLGHGCGPVHHFYQFENIE